MERSIIFGAMNINLLLYCIPVKSKIIFIMLILNMQFVVVYIVCSILHHAMRHFRLMPLPGFCVAWQMRVIDSS